LCADPEQRLGIEGVIQHSWYVQDLAPGVTGYNAALAASAEADGPDDGTLKRLNQVVEELLSCSVAARPSEDDGGSPSGV